MKLILIYSLYNYTIR